jgi:hypothetical protein
MIFIKNAAFFQSYSLFERIISKVFKNTVLHFFLRDSVFG